ncbi:hypothetical protein E4U42_000697 [Claviceps africana]|uniref:G-patch domain-containing protein n=1 Tax=Claviceps africana TaxID=83212 RepID=A0A8K0JA12_9HYPO|nr:hypothetical protein E4U42_000697 [Claviceps africana]
MRRLRNEFNEDEDEDIPLHRKKPFGAGLKRQKVEFVRATESDSGIALVHKTVPTSAVGDLYASIVLGGEKSKPEPKPKPKSASAPATTRGSPQAQPAGSSIVAEEASICAVCAVCSFPITTSAREHEASVAHQVKMPHAHPPSALDRSRMGLRALESLGWDPDARHGLGRDGEGVRYPIKVKAKDDTLGVGAATADETKEKQKQKQQQKQPPPPRKLTGKELKAAVARDKRRAERLQAEMYGRIDVESYLGRTMDE